MAKKFPVLEIFGPTIQGEGSVIGVQTMFVRTAGCDYSCSWCDSAFTWDGSAKDEIKMITAEEIMAELQELGGNRFSHVTISGGNPALLSGLDELIDMLHKHNIKVGLETQGSRWQDWFEKIDDLTISPKPPSSEMKTNFDILDSIIEKLIAAERNGHFSLKVVVFDNQDFDYAKDLYNRYPDVPFYLQVGNDQYNSADNSGLVKHLLRRYEWLIEKVTATGKMNQARVLPQLHTLVWGNKRGV
ncbi:7-carboxy-7-deazaguanine synthase [Bacillus oleivorans]|uniref:7-carboxy-7-deazaguanine synthase n=1 Tax=Bacillus oleivorans TaxID=1448271 RepID=A0A285CMP0_9BACI|nr:7-carboxy-7-deazaguanine synthase QueE [Bacillus oleivorans]SNX68807.1 7-carboxy-7-deazaguanine synthase [Bacillus oleivorans]